MNILSDLNSNLGSDFGLDKNTTLMTPVSSPYFKPFKFGNVNKISSNFVRDEFTKPAQRSCNNDESKKKLFKKNESIKKMINPKTQDSIPEDTDSGKKFSFLDVSEKKYPGSQQKSIKTIKKKTNKDPVAFSNKKYTLEGTNDSIRSPKTIINLFNNPSTLIPTVKMENSMPEKNVPKNDTENTKKSVKQEINTLEIKTAINYSEKENFNGPPKNPTKVNIPGTDKKEEVNEVLSDAKKRSAQFILESGPEKINTERVFKILKSQNSESEIQSVLKPMINNGSSDQVHKPVIKYTSDETLEQRKGEGYEYNLQSSISSITILLRKMCDDVNRSISFRLHDLLKSTLDIDSTINELVNNRDFYKSQVGELAKLKTSLEKKNREKDIESMEIKKRFDNSLDLLESTKKELLDQKSKNEEYCDQKVKLAQEILSLGLGKKNDQEKLSLVILENEELKKNIADSLKKNETLNEEIERLKSDSTNKDEIISKLNQDIKSKKEEVISLSKEKEDNIITFDSLNAEIFKAKLIISSSENFIKEKDLLHTEMVREKNELVVKNEKLNFEVERIKNNTQFIISNKEKSITDLKVEIIAHKESKRLLSLQLSELRDENISTCRFNDLQSKFNEKENDFFNEKKAFLARIGELENLENRTPTEILYEEDIYALNHTHEDVLINKSPLRNGNFECRAEVNFEAENENEAKSKEDELIHDFMENLTIIESNSKLDGDSKIENLKINNGLLGKLNDVTPGDNDFDLDCEDDEMKFWVEDLLDLYASSQLDDINLENSPQATCTNPIFGQLDLEASSSLKKYTQFFSI
ncbi:hypothetical protein AYI68_g2809 [Smittium mucronatum]|uniref:Uncharacterized protein n=1 Tax=Smittium mucronatum TaxID=133383 RepID=A0A1R0H1P3_9FUNG|nr:hypothetical protein AYI68_g5921 [Smittium mucronatum]OLY83057.1 hypothetical protein AYI68_g2809 [Smittium mucronatum]